MNSKERTLEKLKSAVSSRQEAGDRRINALNAFPSSQKQIPEIIPDKKIYSDYISGKDEMLQQFIERQKILRGEVITCESIEKMVNALTDILKTFGPSCAKYFHNDLIAQIFQIQPNIKNYFDLEMDLSISSPDFSRYDVGVSGAEYLVARTGSIFLNSRMAGGRRLTVLPPVHIVLARQSQLVSSLDDVLREIKINDINWSYATFITGPSRTSDIEKKLILGAHGPKRLITIILKEI